MPKHVEFLRQTWRHEVTVAPEQEDKHLKRQNFLHSAQRDKHIEVTYRI